jgi:hypothetical protein
MPVLDNSVGSAGENEPHDQAMVKLMLRLLANKHGGRYYAHPYTEADARQANAKEAELARAIAAFQKDHGLLERVASIPPTSPEPEGRVAPGSRTWMALVEEFVAKRPRYREARTTPGVAVVYLPMPQSRAATGAAEVQANPKLRDGFKQNLASLIAKFHARSAIALSLVPDTGGWRTFAGQQGLVSDAGYGESVHQFGYAVDIGFRGLQVVMPDGRIETAQGSLKPLEKPLASQFFQARNELAGTLDLHGTIKAGDLAHLQAYDDNTLDSVSSLMALMSAVGPRKMKWAPRYKTPTDYLCDLGLGGQKYYVGTAVDIWEESATEHISAADLAAALTARKKAEASFSVEKFLGHTGPALPAALRDADISSEHIQAIQTMLKAEFEAAAANWEKWRPVTYPTSWRRPDNPRRRKKD